MMKRREFITLGPRGRWQHVQQGERTRRSPTSQTAIFVRASGHYYGFAAIRSRMGFHIC
jgi:hypothetical protein